jgi:hypothetical protein
MIDPRHMVPTVVLEGGTAIGEVLAIRRYLEETYPAEPLLGATPRERSRVTIDFPAKALGISTPKEHRALTRGTSARHSSSP